jgi:hypothetical protein
MQEYRIHHIPVVDDSGDLIGLVTLTNVLAATDSVLSKTDNRIHASDIRIEDVMVTEVATVDNSSRTASRSTTTSSPPADPDRTTPQRAPSGALFAATGKSIHFRPDLVGFF